MRYTKTFQVLCFEMFCQFLMCKLIGKSPVIEFKSEILATKTLFETLFQTTLKKYLFRVEIYKQFLDVVECTFGNKEFSC